MAFFKIRYKNCYVFELDGRRHDVLGIY